VDKNLQAVLAEYEQRAADEAKLVKTFTAADFAARRDDLLICVGPETGQLMNILARGAKAKHLVELGASYGYSAHWLADAARATGGKLTSLELSADKVAYAQDRLTRAGLHDYVDFKIGDARESIKSLPNGIDFVLVDLWKDLYTTCFELLYPKLAPGALLVADNMVYPPQYRTDAVAYRNLVKSKPGMTSVLLPVGSGLEVSRYQGD
jgi:predicted O-methyltransferase YrrM